MKIKTYRCPNCGAKIKAGLDYCEYCKTPINKENMVEKEKPKKEVSKNPLVNADGSPAKKEMLVQALIGFVFAFFPTVMLIFVISSEKVKNDGYWRMFPIMVFLGLFSLLGVAVLGQLVYTLIKNKKNKKK